MSENEKQTVRPRMELTNDEIAQVDKIQEEHEGLHDFGKKEAYTKVARTGFDVMRRRDQIREIILDFCEDQKPKHKERVKALKEAYDIDNVEWVTEGTRQIEINGNTYEVTNIAEVTMFNREPLDQSICPECGSTDYTFHSENVGEYDSETEELTDGGGDNYTCDSCGEGFDKLDTRRKAPEDELKQVREYCNKYQELWGAVTNRLDYILDRIFGSYHEWTGEWTNPGSYRYDNGFQSVHIKFWAETYHSIRFNINSLNQGYEDIRTPVDTAGIEVTDDYHRLLEEIHIVNDEADKISPLIIDSHGAYSEEPQVIEVWGVEEEDLTLPAYKIGYELETGYNLPENEEIPEEHQDEDAKPISVIRITNDKPVLKEDEADYEEGEAR